MKHSNRGRTPLEWSVVELLVGLNWFYTAIATTLSLILREVENTT